MSSQKFLDIPPLQSAYGEVNLPGSKSISNRALLLAALCADTTELYGVLDSDDTKVMLSALKKIGCEVQQQDGNVRITGLKNGKIGDGISSAQAPLELFLGNAGTAMRPLTAVLAMLDGHFLLTGIPRMHERPIGDLVDGLHQLGCNIDYIGQQGYPPLRIRPREGKHTSNICVRGNVSSQFLTALLMAAPLAKHAVTITVEGELISKPYIAVTLAMMQRFGVCVERDKQTGWQSFTIAADAHYQSPTRLHVEADASSASYFIALGAIAADARQGHRITVHGVGEASIQGDIRFIDAARSMGAHITTTENSICIERGSWPLRAIDLDCNHIPDAAMTLAVMALYAQGSSTLGNIASWRVKETDRIAAMATELRKLGARVEEGADFIRITPAATAADWKTACIHTYDDHRMAMCFALTALNPAKRSVRIADPACVNKTFPEYFSAFFSLVHTQAAQIPVLCIDGPSASGKGTLAAELAVQLGYHLLDSGALYRVVALATQRAGLKISAENESTIAEIAQSLPVRFTGSHTEQQVWWGSEDISEEIRTEQVGLDASRVSALPAVRHALVALQHNFRRLPGLVADGRDMGTTIFPDAHLKVFLTANVQQRAQRRYKQMLAKKISANIDNLCADLQERDARDQNRTVSPLQPAQDALLLDNSAMDVETSVKQVLDWWQGKQPFAS